MRGFMAFRAGVRLGNVSVDGGFEHDSQAAAMFRLVADLIDKYGVAKTGEILRKNASELKAKEVENN